MVRRLMTIFFRFGPKLRELIHVSALAGFVSNPDAC
jgi:hypothetical protein